MLLANAHYLAARQKRIVSFCGRAARPSSPPSRLHSQDGWMGAWTASCNYATSHFLMVHKAVVPGFFSKAWSQSTKAKHNMVVCSGLCGCLLFGGPPGTRLALLGILIRSFTTWVILFSSQTIWIKHMNKTGNCSATRQQATFRAHCAIDIISDAIREHDHMHHHTRGENPF